MHEQFTAAEGEALVRDLLVFVCEYKEQTMANGDPDAPFLPHFDIRRAGQAVATLLVRSDRDALAEALFMAILAFQADAITVCFDGWQVPDRINPDTGQEWTPETMAAYMATHGRDNGVVTEHLTASLYTAGGLRIGGSLPYVIHQPNDGPLSVTWGEPETFPVSSAEEGAGLVPIAATQAFTRLTDNPDVIAEMRAEWPDLSDTTYYAQMDCSATLGLRELQPVGSVVAVLLQCDRDDTERRDVIEQRLHRSMQNTAAQALQVELRSARAPWN